MVVAKSETRNPKLEANGKRQRGLNHKGHKEHKEKKKEEREHQQKKGEKKIMGLRG